MSDRPPPLPPRPPRTLDYSTPGAESSAPTGAETVFDTVTGPNFRLWDNLIQLAVVTVFTVAGYLLGHLYDQALFGAAAGLFISLILSGAVIGIVRFIAVFRRR